MPNANLFWLLETGVAFADSQPTNDAHNCFASRAACWLIGVAVLAIGSAVLVGYAAHIESLIVLRSGLQGMSPLTAFAVCCIAVSCLLLVQESGEVARLVSIPALGVGLIILISHAILHADVLSTWVASHLFGMVRADIGRTSIATAGCITALSSGILLNDRVRVADTLAGCVVVVSALAMLGYAYGVRDLYAIPIFDSMALHTAVALFLLSLALILGQPGSGWGELVRSRDAVSRATRRQLIFTALPAVAGWLLLRFVQAGRVGTAAALALLVILTVAPLALLVLRDARALMAFNRARARHQRAQQELQRDLQSRLEAQAQELNAAATRRVNTEAALYRSQRLEALGQLTGGIAHDFNNLLMAVGGNIEIIAKLLPRDHRAAPYIDKARRSITQGASLTQKLLSFSPIQKLDIRPVEIDVLLGTTRKLIGGALGPNIDIQVQLGASGANAATDPHQLELAILNLAFNARDAMPSGGTMTVRSRYLECGVAGSKPAVSIAVTDTGAGMSPEISARATEPFFTTRNRGPGSGLGLAQVSGLVQQCHGELNISSEPGSGTTVEIVLPAVESESPWPSVSTGIRTDDLIPVTHQRQPVLVIDDDEGVREVIVTALREAEYDVHEAEDGLAGLALLGTVKPALAIIDFILPGATGAEVALEAQQRIPGLPVVFVSGYFDTAALERVPNAVVLRKPFDTEALKQLVAAVLQRMSAGGAPGRAM